MSDGDLGAVLTGLARAAIAERLALAAPAPRTHARLAHPGAAFVTLTQQGRLRGCVGSLEARRPLGVDVRENALVAAFGDPRFAPLAAAEFAATRIEVSLLSPSEPVRFDSEAHLLAQLEPGVDGLILEHERQRATFLPQVWESLPDPRAFVAELKRKAGLPPTFWSAQLRIRRYRVAKYREDGVPAPAAR
jgi:hypothetical protein